MIIPEIETVHDPRQVTEPVVTHDGSTVTVKPGVYRSRKVEHEVVEDWEYDLEAKPLGRVVTGYLVRVRDQDEPLRLFVDEVGYNDTPYQFNGSAYEAIYCVFRIVAEAGKSPSEFSVVVYHRKLIERT